MTSPYTHSFSISTIIELLDENENAPATQSFMRSLVSLQESLEVGTSDTAEVQKCWQAADDRFNRLLVLGLWGLNEKEATPFENLGRQMKLLLHDGAHVDTGTCGQLGSSIHCYILSFTHVKRNSDSRRCKSLFTILR